MCVGLLLTKDAIVSLVFKICANNNDDCCIDCNGPSASAIWIEPVGPCLTDCGEDAFASGIVRALQEEDEVAGDRMSQSFYCSAKFRTNGFDSYSLLYFMFDGLSFHRHHIEELVEQYRDVFADMTPEKFDTLKLSNEFGYEKKDPSSILKEIINVLNGPEKLVAVAG